MQTTRSKARLVALALVIALSLGGCFSGEPSEKDMANALHNNATFRQMLAVTTSLATPGRGIGKLPDIDHLIKAGVVGKVSCSAAQGMAGYVCDFRWGQRQADGSVKYGQLVKARFFKAGGEWNMEDSR